MIASPRDPLDFKWSWVSIFGQDGEERRRSQRRNTRGCPWHRALSACVGLAVSAKWYKPDETAGSASDNVRARTILHPAASDDRANRSEEDPVVERFVDMTFEAGRLRA